MVSKFFEPLWFEVLYTEALVAFIGLVYSIYWILRAPGTKLVFHLSVIY